MSPNQQQLASLLRTAFASLGGILIGWFASKGWTLSPDDQKSLLALLQSPELIGFAVSGITAIFGLIAHTHQNAVATVAAIAADPQSAVVGVVTTSDQKGRNLAASIPHTTVAPATSGGATAIANDTIPPLDKKAA